MVGDGNSATYQTIKNTYDGITVVKGECVGHVQKRVGKNLRDLTKKQKKKKTAVCYLMVKGSVGKEDSHKRS